MTTGTFNFGDLLKAADDAGFSVVPVGDYPMEVATAEVGATSTGKHKISTRFKILSGPYQGKSIFNDFILSPESGAALGFFFRHMKVLGLDRGYFDHNPPLTSVASSIIGRQCMGTVGVRVWNEQERNELKGIKALPGAVIGSAPMMPTPHQFGAPMAMPTSPFPTPVPAAMTMPGPAPRNILQTPGGFEDATPPITDAAAAMPFPADMPFPDEPPF